MERLKLEVADVFRRYGESYRQQHGASLSAVQRRVMSAIEVCRTAALGGHLERCDKCGQERNCFNSCRNRHCPKCQSLARAQWIEDRQTELLDCPYYHVVFTVPQEIAALVYQNQEVVYSILFRATAETLQTIAADPQHLGADMDLSELVQQLGMVNRTNELSLLPVVSDQGTLHPHGFGVFAILLQQLSTNLQRTDGDRIQLSGDADRRRLSGGAVPTLVQIELTRSRADVFDSWL